MVQWGSDKPTARAGDSFSTPARWAVACIRPRPRDKTSKPRRPLPPQLRNGKSACAVRPNARGSSWRAWRRGRTLRMARRRQCHALVMSWAGEFTASDGTGGSDETSGEDEASGRGEYSEECTAPGG